MRPTIDRGNYFGALEKINKVKNSAKVEAKNLKRKQASKQASRHGHTNARVFQ